MASEKKMSSIGSRLNYMGKEKMEENSHFHEKMDSKFARYMRSQNSTIKLGMVE